MSKEFQKKKKKHFILRYELVLVMVEVGNRWSKSRSIRYFSWHKLVFNSNEAVQWDSVFMGEPPTPFKIRCEFMVYGTGIMRVQHVRNWCPHFGTGG